MFNFLFPTVAVPFYTPIHNISTKSLGLLNLDQERLALNLFLVSLGLLVWNNENDTHRREKAKDGKNASHP